MVHPGRETVETQLRWSACALSKRFPPQKKQAAQQQSQQQQSQQQQAGGEGGDGGGDGGDDGASSDGEDPPASSGGGVAPTLNRLSPGDSPSKGSGIARQYSVCSEISNHEAL